MRGLAQDTRSGVKRLKSKKKRSSVAKKEARRKRVPAEKDRGAFLRDGAASAAVKSAYGARLLRIGT